ncbi:winged helix-turn-helix transcriptional regulator [Candidatus Uhrbacteria bacterium]|nr:winged helix-turn-helix transcriptional regulator [Candidatus Uhrbacteria bacterium]
MVELTLDLDLIFGSLSHHIRRDLLRRAVCREMSISDAAKPYGLSLNAISKHLKVLEKAKLIIKRRRGKELIIQPSEAAFADASKYLRTYEKLWNNRLDNLERYLSSSPQ